MDVEKGRGWSRGMTTLEKGLIFLFVAMTGACIGLVVVYFSEKPDSSPYAEGECVYFLFQYQHVSEVQNMLQYCANEVFISLVFICLLVSA